MPSTSPKQARTMAAAAHNPAFAIKMGIPVKVAKDFNKADTGKHMIHMADGGLLGLLRPQGFPDVIGRKKKLVSALPIRHNRPMYHKRYAKSQRSLLTRRERSKHLLTPTNKVRPRRARTIRCWSRNSKQRRPSQK